MKQSRKFKVAVPKTEVLEQPHWGVFMQITVEELKIQPYEIISHIAQGYDLTIMYNGKPYAKIIPLDDETTDVESNDSENELFGLWKDRFDADDDVAFYVRKMRQGRKL
jgi:antitoxin (DNA-binding transcriptional repressor) of toxin-antitoxin stability system